MARNTRPLTCSSSAKSASWCMCTCCAGRLRPAAQRPAQSLSACALSTDTSMGGGVSDLKHTRRMWRMGRSQASKGAAPVDSQNTGLQVPELQSVSYSRPCVKELGSCGYSFTTCRARAQMAHQPQAHAAAQWLWCYTVIRWRRALRGTATRAAQALRGGRSVCKGRLIWWLSLPEGTR
jgi:hypothetical protein